MDPVPGGNANAYTYSPDPINSSDYSGRSSACAILCVSAAQLSGMQSSVGATQIQPTVTIGAYQSTISASRIIYSNAAASTIKVSNVLLRSAVKPDNSTALPIARVQAGTISVERSSAAPVYATPPQQPLLIVTLVSWVQSKVVEKAALKA